MTATWVVGSGGLVGSAICRALRNAGQESYAPEHRFSWREAALVDREVSIGTANFARQVVSAGSWEIFWAAGVGTMGSTEGSLASETGILGVLLRSIESNPILMVTPGVFVFCSSAGAIYAGASDFLVGEDSFLTPTTAYGREKLKQEQLVRTFAQSASALRRVIVRLSTVYGPGQSHGKQQGLLANIARRMIANQPIQIYVPFDTVRDYITADDAARGMMLLARLNDGAKEKTRILASEQPVTIAEIISTFKRVAGRSPRVVTSANPLGIAYPRRVCFRSTATTPLEVFPRTSLLLGVSQLIAAERIALMQWGRR